MSKLKSFPLKGSDKLAVHIILNMGIYHLKY